MKPNSTFVILGVAILVASACTSVTTKHPLSSKPGPIDQEKFEGVWHSYDEIYHVRFCSNGVAKLASVVWESNQFHTVHGEMIVTEGEEQNFLSIRFQDEEWMEEYWLLQYTFADDDTLVLWAPDGDAFEKLVEEEKLHGILEHEDFGSKLNLTNIPERLLQVINDPDDLKLFEYREPMVYRRIVGEKE